MELTLFEQQHLDLSKHIISETLFVKESVGMKHLGIQLILANCTHKGFPQNLSLF